MPLIRAADDGPPRVPVTDMHRSLGFYLDLGCEVRRAADGWALLSCGRTSFVLHVRTAADGPAPVCPPLRLDTSDVRALRRRLLAVGVTGVLVRSAGGRAGRLELVDPDRHAVVLDQADNGVDRPVPVRSDRPGRTARARAGAGRRGPR